MIWVDRHLWPILIVLAVIYTTGITGTWLSQNTAPMPWNINVVWGYLCAAILGGVVFGGLRTIAKGSQVKGIGITLTGGVCAVLVDYHFFAQQHDVVSAIVLGLSPTLVAVLAGLIEADQIEQAVQVVEAKEEKQQEWELKEASKDRAAERKITVLKAKQEAGIVSERAEHRENGSEHVLNTPKWITDNLKRSFAVFVQDNPLAGYREIVQNVGLSSTSGVKPLAEACGYAKNGDGWEKVNGH